MADETKKEKKGGAPARPETTHASAHTTTIGGVELAYTATVGTLNLKDDKDKERASFFYTSYVLDGVVEPSTRPVTFCFNGGPGSASVWLHMGVLGPRRIDIDDAVAPGPPPYTLVDNELGMLDTTDLVFIDPVGTGFSRPLGKATGKDFHGVKGDIESVGRFIELWLSRTGRWNSAKYVIGESYGTTRAAALAMHLLDRGVVVNGLVLVSVALDFKTLMFEAGNDLPNAMFLPTYTATAHYHGRLPDPPDDLDALLDEVRAFAIDEYMPALMKGARLDQQTKTAVAAKLARYTGLAADDIADRCLRIEDMWFSKNLLPGHGHTVGRLDSRYAGRDHERDAPKTMRDPAFDYLMGPYTALANDYLRRELGWVADEAYTVISLEVNSGWDWKQGDRFGFINVGDDLRRAIISAPHLKVLMMNGLYDLATPFFAAEYTADHIDPTGGANDNLTLTWYEAGHMMYLHPPSLDKMRHDLLAFYGSGQ